MWNSAQISEQTQKGRSAAQWISAWTLDIHASSYRFQCSHLCILSISLSCHFSSTLHFEWVKLRVQHSWPISIWVWNGESTYMRDTQSRNQCFEVISEKLVPDIEALPYHCLTWQFLIPSVSSTLCRLLQPLKPKIWSICVTRNILKIDYNVLI